MQLMCERGFAEVHEHATKADLCVKIQGCHSGPPQQARHVCKLVTNTVGELFQHPGRFTDTHLLIFVIVANNRHFFNFVAVNLESRMCVLYIIQSTFDIRPICCV